MHMQGFFFELPTVRSSEDPSFKPDSARLPSRAWFHRRQHPKVLMPHLAPRTMRSLG